MSDKNDRCGGRPPAPACFDRTDGLTPEEAAATRRFLGGDETAWPIVAESIDRRVILLADQLKEGRDA